VRTTQTRFEEGEVLAILAEIPCAVRATLVERAWVMRQHICQWFIEDRSRSATGKGGRHRRSSTARSSMKPRVSPMNNLLYRDDRVLLLNIAAIIREDVCVSSKL